MDRVAEIIPTAGPTALLVALALLAPPAQAETVLKPGVRLWMDPHSSTAQIRGDDAQRLAAIPGATWLTGGPPRADARRVTLTASRRGAVPVLVAYNLPGRDCGEYSAGGAKSAKAYRTWIDGLAKGIGNRRAVVIVEPDAIAGGCTRSRDVKGAVERLRKLKRTAVYIDAGHSHWHGAREIVKRLKASGIARADGFALNLSNYRTNAELIAYGTDVSNRVAGRHFVIDTSRNGRARGRRTATQTRRTGATRPAAASGSGPRRRRIRRSWTRSCGSSSAGRVRRPVHARDTRAAGPRVGRGRPRRRPLVRAAGGGNDLVCEPAARERRVAQPLVLEVDYRWMTRWVEGSTGAPAPCPPGGAPSRPAPAARPAGRAR